MNPEHRIRRTLLVLGLVLALLNSTIADKKDNEKDDKESLPDSDRGSQTSDREHIEVAEQDEDGKTKQKDSKEHKLKEQEDKQTPQKTERPDKKDEPKAIECTKPTANTCNRGCCSQFHFHLPPGCHLLTCFGCPSDDWNPASFKSKSFLSANCPADEAAQQQDASIKAIVVDTSGSRTQPAGKVPSYDTQGASSVQNNGKTGKFDNGRSEDGRDDEAKKDKKNRGLGNRHTEDEGEDVDSRENSNSVKLSQSNGRNPGVKRTPGIKKECGRTDSEDNIPIYDNFDEDSENRHSAGRDGSKGHPVTQNQGWYRNVSPYEQGNVGAIYHDLGHSQGGTIISAQSLDDDFNYMQIPRSDYSVNDLSPTEDDVWCCLPRSRVQSLNPRRKPLTPPATRTPYRSYYNDPGRVLLVPATATKSYPSTYKAFHYRPPIHQ